MRNINIIKKSLLGIMSAAAIATGSVNPAFAADTQITSFTKEYQANIPNNAETSAYPSPAETFSFQDSKGKANQADLVAVKYTSFNSETSELQNITDLANKPNSANTVMNLVLGSATFDAGAAGTTGEMTKSVPVSIPDGSAYTVPGNYYYYFKEAVGATAGVYYNTNNDNTAIEYLILVPVKSDNKKMSVDEEDIRILKANTANVKVDTITNSYNAGSFDFKKVVEGTAGDVTKTFQVNVTLTKPEGKTMSSTISVANAGTDEVPNSNELSDIRPNDWKDNTITKTFTVKDGTDIRLSNIPAGTKYLVQEQNAPGYETTYTIGEATSPIATDNLTQTLNPAQSATIVITNKRDQIVDTGVFTSNLPYFIILIAAAGGLVIFLASRKHRV